MLRWPKSERVVEVLWEDTMGGHGWSEEPVKATALIASVGYLHRDDEEGVVLVESKDRGPGAVKKYGCSTMIPRSAVRGMRVLRK